MAETKTAAYICKGCEIDKRVDVASLSKVATKSGKMNLVREHDFLCSAEGVAMIRNDIETEGVTHAAICACSRRAKTEAFNFPTIAMSRGNLREGV
ncbi:MAG TPA: heterodisulfide reductase, partial [Thiobacillaceae bacterium]|nr:heterodisulfide reductase [Thiobacillaceae bacterium]